jgi:hypothetical protein
VDYLDHPAQLLALQAIQLEEARQLEEATRQAEALLLGVAQAKGLAPGEIRLPVLPKLNPNQSQYQITQTAITLPTIKRTGNTFKTMGSGPRV